MQAFNREQVNGKDWACAQGVVGLDLMVRQAPSITCLPLPSYAQLFTSGDAGHTSKTSTPSPRMYPPWEDSNWINSGPCVHNIFQPANPPGAVIYPLMTQDERVAQPQDQRQGLCTTGLVPQSGFHNHRQQPSWPEMVCLPPEIVNAH
mmetsp:Transcript_77813/g.137185  ORF Transcript_77813/g.137185 Transcript_77813/m.137185 type:complete len:148 (+) Transcript_77813:647-1090(+)